MRCFTRRRATCSPCACIRAPERRSRREYLQKRRRRAGLPRAGVASSLAAREKLGSTGLGQGIAIPHGRIHGLREAVGAFARLRKPVPFDAPDGKPVDQLFVLLVPEHATDQHLQLLSELAQMFSERTFRERLTQAPSAAALADVFRNWQSAG